MAGAPQAATEALRATLEARLQELAENGGLPTDGAASAALAATLPRVWTCSEFVAQACLRDAELLPWLAADGRLQVDADADWFAATSRAIGLDDATLDEEAYMAALRRYRRRHLVRIAWRDLAGYAETETVLRELSLLADACIGSATSHAHAALVVRHGAPLAADGSPLSLLILGMGKLGGGELNFSSDIDLVFLFAEHGETDGPRPLAHEEFFIRLGKRVAQLLGSITADGFVYRVDLRLRPFGESGPVAVSFDAFEDYLQEHGRDWERYAYVKARPVAGAERFADLYRNVLRPFVYRRYLDFGVLESLREMKDLITREVERRELQDNIKLGPGGIREIEFMVQAFQLLRGGSNPRLQSRSLLATLPLLQGQKLLSASAVEELDAAYRYLRRLENRLQEWNDEQTHDLPTDATARARLAVAMGSSDWSTLAREITDVRARVAQWFQRTVFAPAQPVSGDASAQAAARLLDAEPSAAQHVQALESLGVQAVEPVLAQLDRLRDSSYYRRLDATGHRRLQLLLPQLLRAVAATAEEEVTLARLLGIIEHIGGRTVYLALLNENPSARQRLVDLCAVSGFLSGQVAAFPLLLDELLDERLFTATPTRAELANELQSRMEATPADDPELQVEALRQFQRAAVFRVAVPDLTGRMSLMKVSDRLTDIAELIVAEALSLAWQQMTARHGLPLCGERDDALRECGMVVVAYGKFGGFELGYGSDLDLVFLHDSQGAVQQTAGPQSVDNTVFFLRLVQRLVHLLTVHSAAGRLYEVDTRLRPSGSGGPLVQSITGFASYEREEAWTWEHQSLLRARAVAGPEYLCERFADLRRELLRDAVHRDTLRTDVRQMRERMRAELSKAGPGQFDLKQDAGGITDIEFLAQYWSLCHADRYVELIEFTDNIRQLESLASIDLVPQATVDVLTAAYRLYRQRLHHLSLEGGGNVVAAEEFATTRAEVTAIWQARMTDTAPAAGL
jgi:glutamate-ammonia-ligase adenylyltransferase